MAPVRILSRVRRAYRSFCHACRSRGRSNAVACIGYRLRRRSAVRKVGVQDSERAGDGGEVARRGPGGRQGKARERRGVREEAVVEVINEAEYGGCGGILKGSRYVLNDV